MARKGGQDLVAALRTALELYLGLGERAAPRSVAADQGKSPTANKMALAMIAALRVMKVTKALTAEQWRARVPKECQGVIQVLEVQERFYAAGDHSALVNCIYICALTTTPLPPWVREVWAASMDELLAGRIDSWDPVLGHVRARTEQQQLVAARERAEVSNVMRAAQKVGRAVPIQRGDPPGSFFALVGKRLQIEPSAARKLYYCIPREIRTTILKRLVSRL